MHILLLFGVSCLLSELVLLLLELRKQRLHFVSDLLEDLALALRLELRAGHICEVTHIVPALEADTEAVVAQVLMDSLGRAEVRIAVQELIDQGPGVIVVLRRRVVPFVDLLPHDIDQFLGVDLQLAEVELLRSWKLMDFLCQLAVAHHVHHPLHHAFSLEAVHLPLDLLSFIEYRAANPFLLAVALGADCRLQEGQIVPLRQREACLAEQALLVAAETPAARRLLQVSLDGGKERVEQGVAEDVKSEDAKYERLAGLAIGELTSRLFLLLLLHGFGLGPLLGLDLWRVVCHEIELLDDVGVDSLLP